MEHEDDSWASWSRHILSELERQHDDINTLYELHNKNIETLMETQKAIALMQGKFTILLLMLGAAISACFAVVVHTILT
jgi:hypothetical protein